MGVDMGRLERGLQKLIEKADERVLHLPEDSAYAGLGNAEACNVDSTAQNFSSVPPSPSISSPSTAASSTASLPPNSMPSSWLPTEIYRHILLLVPATTRTPNCYSSDTRARVLAHFGQACRAFRNVTLHPSLWEECYRARYTMHDEGREQTRRRRFKLNLDLDASHDYRPEAAAQVNYSSGNANLTTCGEAEGISERSFSSSSLSPDQLEEAVDWRRLYLVRREMDLLAMVALRALASEPEHVERVRKVVDDLGFDVWNQLEEVLRQPIHGCLRRGASSSSGANTGASLPDGVLEHKARGSNFDLTLRYWAKEVQCVMCRRQAISMWQRIRRVHQGRRLGLSSTPVDASLHVNSRPVEFGEAMAALSAFWGVPIADTLLRFDILARKCKEFLEENGVKYVKGEEGYNATTLCRSICAFMRSVGYNRIDGNRFSHLYNNFPHIFLTTRPRSLPMSLVCIFVSIARRLGLAATPINSIGRVTAYLDGVVVDVFDSARNPILRENMTVHPGVPPSLSRDESSLGDVINLTTLSMLMRSGRNIQNANSEGSGSWINQPSPSEGQGNMYERKLGDYASDCIFALISSEPLHALGSLVEFMQAWFPLDFEFVIRDRFFPTLSERSKRILETEYEEKSIFRKKGKVRRRVPCMNYFVGQIVRIAMKPLSLWVIVDWQKTMTKNNQEEIRYDLISSRGLHFHSMMENKLQSADCPMQIGAEFLSWNPTLGMNFCDFEYVRTDDSDGEQIVGRARFVINEHLKRVYPEDDVYGKSWIEMPGRTL